MEVKSKKLDIASTIDTSLYGKPFTRNMIQAGLQKENHFSSILYLNDYYKTNCIIYNKATGKYYSTCLKKYEPFIATEFISASENQFSKIDEQRVAIGSKFDLPNKSSLRLQFIIQRKNLLGKEITINNVLGITFSAKI